MSGSLQRRGRWRGELGFGASVSTSASRNETSPARKAQSGARKRLQSIVAEPAKSPLVENMKLEFEHRNQRYVSDTKDAISIAITLKFEGPQPNHFGTDAATRDSLRLGEFVGDTKLGGSCNVDVLKLVPHCNGTHTETVSHIVHEPIEIGDAAIDWGCLAALVSLPTRAADQTNETYRPALNSTDSVITRTDLQRAMQTFANVRAEALIIRTLPNDVDKRTRQYANARVPGPAFFTAEAMEYIDSLDCQHLLVDIPSVDRMYDEGLLTNHHIFWRVREGSHSRVPETRCDRTITEMIFVPDHVEDGLCLLNLQVPAFALDAAPSRPLIIPVQLRPSD